MYQFGALNTKCPRVCRELDINYGEEGRRESELARKRRKKEGKRRPEKNVGMQSHLFSHPLEGVGKHR